MIQSITLRGLLSYGWEPITLPLRQLNLLIGINGSGKTNLLDALDLLHCAPIDVQRPLRNKGGAADWLHKGKDGDRQAWLEVVLDTPPHLLRYRLELNFIGDLPLVSERLETAAGHPDAPFLFLLSNEGRATVRLLHPNYRDHDEMFGNYQWLLQEPNAAHTALSILRGNPNTPQINQVSTLLDAIYLLQGWTFGPAAPARSAQAADQSGKAPLDNGYNLAVVLHRLQQDGATWTRLRDRLRKLYPLVDDIETEAMGGQVKFFLREQGLGQHVPQSRISDGTLRWLGFLCLLLDPRPPPLICLEEPELGLHPDLIATLAGLLREASQRTQLVVTTHSDALVSAFSETPQDVVVCERTARGTTLRRLDPDDVAVWLDSYSLGRAWLRGAFGGTRW